jgi:hypothetical protein
MSNVEYALQKLSGTTRPVECWGCKGPHLYSNCPHKDNPAVYRNFKENSEKFKKEKLAQKTQQTAGGPNFRVAAMSKDKPNGFGSKAIYKTLMTALSDNTTLTEREHALQELSTKIAAHYNTNRGKGK